MSWFKTIINTLQSRGDIDEELILMLMCSLIMKQPLLIIGNFLNIDLILACFIKFDVINLHKDTAADDTLCSSDRYTLLNSLENASDEVLLKIIMNLIKNPFQIFCVSSTHLWSLPPSLLSQIPLSYVITKSCPSLQSLDLLSRDFLIDIQGKMSEVYISPHINILVHQIISKCHSHTSVLHYHGAKQEFLLGLQALGVILQKDFVNETMIPAICQKAMLHKLVFMPDLVWTILPAERSFIDERKSLIVEIIKQVLL
eukprot:NODE_448_length_8440_cov_0.772329.p4 type:complete len:257 gc:universal NODE_448_length_8440_cov_0.772329:6671-5901(-)